MRKWLVGGIGVLLAIGFAVSHMMRLKPPPESTTSLGTVEQRAAAALFLDLLDAGAYDEALAMTASEVANGLADGRMQGIWEGLPQRLGPRQARGSFHELKVDGRTVIGSRLQFRDQAMDIHLQIDARGRVAGFQLVPAGAQAE